MINVFFFNLGIFYAQICAGFMYLNECYWINTWPLTSPV